MKLFGGCLAAVAIQAVLADATITRNDTAPAKPAVIVHVLVVSRSIKAENPVCSSSIINSYQPPQDDMGYSDLGFRDPKVSTPTIDELARQGVALTSYYAWKYCNPSRSMLLTGRYMHNVGIYSNGGAPALSFALLPQRLKQIQPATKAYMMGCVRCSQIINATCGIL